MMEKILVELRASADRPELSADWSESTWRVYFDAAAFHGLEVEGENAADIYSYAMEAAEALKPVIAELKWVNPHHHLEMMRLKAGAEKKVDAVLTVLTNGRSPSDKLRLIENIILGK